MSKLLHNLIQVLDKHGWHLLAIRYHYGNSVWSIEVESDGGFPRRKDFQNKTFTRAMAELVIFLQGEEDTHDNQPR